MKIAVIGAGLMGSGIAQVCLQAEHEVTLIDVSATALNAAKANLEKRFAAKIRKGSLSEQQKHELFTRLAYSDQMNDAAVAEIIIEAVPEKVEVKKQVFAQLNQVRNQSAVILSNTSGLGISELAAETECAHKVMGFHFFYPAPVMKLIELVRGIATDDATYKKARDFAASIGKRVVDAPEYPGFIVNRVLVPMQNEAAFLVMEGCRPEDVDAAMKLGANHPMGPLELTDFVGVDVMLATMTGLYQGFRDSKYRPCPLLERMVKAGHLGRKTGRGFYKYNEGGERI